LWNQLYQTQTLFQTFIIKPFEARILTANLETRDKNNYCDYDVSDAYNPNFEAPRYERLLSNLEANNMNIFSMSNGEQLLNDQLFDIQFHSRCFLHLISHLFDTPNVTYNIDLVFFNKMMGSVVAFTNNLFTGYDDDVCSTTIDW